MKKALFLAAAVLCGAPAFGYPGDFLSTTATRVLQGEGSWRDSSGQIGDYEVTVTLIEEGEGTIKVEELFIFGKDQKRLSFKLVKTGDHFFDVHGSEGKVGDGYCLEDKHKFAKSCHLDYDFGDFKGEHTLKVDTVTGSVTRMGSCTHPDKKVLWHDALRRWSR